MKITAEVKKSVNTWINALRSGDFKQTQSVLQDTEGYCCLGVACKITIPTNKLTLQEDTDDYCDVSEMRLLSGELPSQQKNAPRWLKDIDDDFEERAGITLSLLNDKGIAVEVDGKAKMQLLTFDEIADLLQLVYIENAKVDYEDEANDDAY